MRLFAILLSLWLISTITPTYAQELLSTPAQKELGKYIWPGQDLYAPLPTTRDRQAFARAIRDVCQEYRNEVPSLSPDEETWLKEELKHAGKRITAAINSPIYPRWLVSLTFDRCIEFTDAIGTIPGADIPKNWAILAITLNEDDIFETYGRFGVDGNNTPVIGAVNMMTREASNTILRRVILPNVEWQQ